MQVEFPTLMDKKTQAMGCKITCIYIIRKIALTDICDLRDITYNSEVRNLGCTLFKRWDLRSKI